ncbi:Nudix hydrolase 27, chloroplastic [Linum perenne]
MLSASCEVIGRSSQVYIVGDGRCRPSKSIKFNQVPTISCHQSKNPSNSSVSVPARRVNGATTNTTAKFPDGYRRSVGICLVKPSKMVFMGSRTKSTRFFQMPQGGANEGEDLRSAAMRELQEETGVTSAEFLAEAPYWMSYDFPPHSRHLLNRRWGTNYKGQAQKWFLFKFTGNEEEINILGDGSKKPEFVHWSWILAEKVVESQAVDYKKQDYGTIMEFFIPYLQEEYGDAAELQKPVHSKSLDGLTPRLMDKPLMNNRSEHRALSH